MFPGGDVEGGGTEVYIIYSVRRHGESGLGNFSKNEYNKKRGKGKWQSFGSVPATNAKG